MGEYYIVLNLTKRERLHAHAVNNGLKRREHMSPGHRIPRLLWLLLAREWSGDQIVVASDEGTNRTDLYETEDDFADKTVEYFKAYCEEFE